jgi:hypothetical protein
MRRLNGGNRPFTKVPLQTFVFEATDHRLVP